MSTDTTTSTAKTTTKASTSRKTASTRETPANPAPRGRSAKGSTSAPERTPSKRQARGGKVPAVYAGTAATLRADGTVLALTPSVYPEVVEAEGLTLLCAGCGEHRPVSRFAFTTKRGAGRGRMVVERACQVARLARNVEWRKANRPTEPSPRLDPEHVIPST